MRVYSKLSVDRQPSWKNLSGARQGYGWGRAWGDKAGLHECYEVKWLANPGPIQDPKSWRSEKCISKSEKCRFWPLQKKDLKSQLNSLKKSEKSRKLSQKDYLIEFSRPFSGGVKNGIFRTSKCTVRISRISGPVWGRGVASHFSKTYALQTCHKMKGSYGMKITCPSAK